ncbi:MAG: DNA methyltransferase, partial [Chloroflexales bacterium]
FDFMDTLSKVRVLDPACGSGNFLYVALHQLKDLEQEVWRYAGGLELTQPELGVTPLQLHGIEKNPFAAELAQVVVWIGYLQWLRLNGWLEGQPIEPILQTLHSIECKDAILAFDADGQPVEPEWPEADVIIGNPPFLGGKRLRAEMGSHYVDAIFTLYDKRVPRESDLVLYWFERARAIIELGGVERVGLLATSSIRGGANRKVLDRIKQVGDIFMAWSDREWILDDASVRVSMVCFDAGSETVRKLDGTVVQCINSDLTSNIDLTKAKRLPENSRIAFMGDTKGGAFDLTPEHSALMIGAPLNPNGRPNTDVVVPWVNGLDITRQPRGMFIIDFGVDMSKSDAALYELPFAHVERTVKPERLKNNRATYRDRWWIHVEPRTALRAAIKPLKRYIGTPNLTKHRIFAWLQPPTLPDHQLIVFARDDDYFFGVLHTKLHELWALRLGTSLGETPRYTPSTTFETYPFPWSPGTEPHEDADPRVKAIADAARDLVHLRDAWLNEPGLSAAELKKRTLTNLYNQRPDWLSVAHRTLDAAVFTAYGWPSDLSDDAILAQLLALNLERAAGQGAAVPVVENDQADDEEE